MKELLKKRGLSLRAAALKSGIHPTMIYRWAKRDYSRRDNPRLDSLQKLSQGTGIPLEDLARVISGNGDTP